MSDDDSGATDAETVADVGDEVADNGGSGSAPRAHAVLDYLVRSVVEDPDGVNVAASDGRRHDLSLDVTVSDGDMGRVIGRRGRVAQAIRTVTRAAAVQDDLTVDIEFLE